MQLFNRRFCHYFLQICATLVLVNAAEKAAKNLTAKIATEKDQRGKRNLNLFGNYYGADRRISAGNYDYHNSRQQPQYAAYTQQRPQVYSGEMVEH